MKNKLNLWETYSKAGLPSENSKPVSFRYEKGIDPVLKKKYMLFAAWLRKNYRFPVKLHVYVLNTETVRLRSGKTAYGSFRWFPKRSPVIRIPSAVDPGLLSTCSLNEIHEMILSSLVHELSHYYQWVSGLEQSSAVSERQANYYRYRILERFYADLPETSRKLFD